MIRGPGSVARPRSTRGQATVELALILPLVVIVALAVVQVALVGRHRLLLIHAAREGARVAAVGASDEVVRSVVADASGIDRSRLRIEVRRRSTTVEVIARFRSPTDLPVIGALTADVELAAAATMQRERPP